MTKHSDSISDLQSNLLLTDHHADDDAAFKFDLFLMTREIKQITASLRQITLLPTTHQRRWVQDNQHFLHHFMESLTQDVFAVMDEVDLDQDSLAETIDCVTQLRQLATTLNNLLVGKSKLHS